MRTEGEGKCADGDESGVESRVEKCGRGNTFTALQVGCTEDMDEKSRTGLVDRLEGAGGLVVLSIRS